MRLFVAAYPPAEAVADLAALVSTLHLGRPTAPGRSVRLVPPDRWHLTLAFLGDVDDHRADEAVTATAAAVTRWRDAGGVPPTLRLAGGGHFGRGRSTVVWTGADGATSSLNALATGLRQTLRRARLPVDATPFRAHLTLARPGDRLPADGLAADLAALDAYRGPSWQLPEVRLVRSILGPQPVHEPVATIPLAPGILPRMATSNTGDATGEVLLVAVVEMAPGHEDAGRRYEDAVLALLDRHGGSIERRLRSTGSASEVHVIRFGSPAGQRSFMVDPDRLALRAALGDAAPTTRVLEVRDVGPDIPGGDGRS